MVAIIILKKCVNWQGVVNLIDLKIQELPGGTIEKVNKIWQTLKLLPFDSLHN